MARLSATLLDLARLRKKWGSTALNGGRAPGIPLEPAGASRLVPVADFGSNPGALRMLAFVPEELPPSPALVVVLHGCTQTASGYDLGAGWSTLAERFGFVLVCPEQSTANNPKACFNWFVPGDVTRGAGEALSIRQMVERAVLDHGVDRSRIFVTGLSAGGAMAAVMLATYPEVFAGGAVVAGLPYGSASNVQEALQAMFTMGSRPPREWGDLVRAASNHEGSWPRLSIWHGGADTVVKPANAQELIKQWTDVHGLPLGASRHDIVDGYPRDVWCDASGREVIESFTIRGMGHGTPIHVGTEDHMAGAAGAFLLDVGIASSYHIAKFWGLTEGARPASARAVRAQPSSGEVALVSSDGSVTMPRGPDRAGASSAQRKPPEGAAQAGPNEIGRIIENALRAAGLMRR